MDNLKQFAEHLSLQYRVLPVNLLQICILSIKKGAEIAQLDDEDDQHLFVQAAGLGCLVPKILLHFVNVYKVVGNEG